MTATREVLGMTFQQDRDHIWRNDHPSLTIELVEPSEEHFTPHWGWSVWALLSNGSWATRSDRGCKTIEEALNCAVSCVSSLTAAKEERVER